MSVGGKCCFYTHFQEVGTWQSRTFAPTTTALRGRSLNPTKRRYMHRRRSAVSAENLLTSASSFPIRCHPASTTSSLFQETAIPRISAICSLLICAATGRSPTSLPRNRNLQRRRKSYQTACFLRPLTGKRFKEAWGAAPLSGSSPIFDK